MLSHIQNEQDIRLAEQFIRKLIEFKNRINSSDDGLWIPRDLYLNYSEIEVIARVLRVGIGELSK